MKNNPVPCYRDNTTAKSGAVIDLESMLMLKSDNNIVFRWHNKLILQFFLTKSCNFNNYEN